METELTKEIKMLTHTYRPRMSNSKVGRTIRYADEVCTPNGIVDSIRFEDYVVSRTEDCELINWATYEEPLKQRLQQEAARIERTLGECKIFGQSFPNQHCMGCFYRKRGDPVIGMMITAYEVKITKADFFSVHGHSIDNPDFPIGNESYYCLPKDLVPAVIDRIPEHVGVLQYANGRLKKIRESKWMEVPEQVKISLLYNALKKWCDKEKMR